MEVRVNGNTMLLANDQTNVFQLLELLNIPSVGVAVAIDNKIAVRGSWETTMLKENNNVTIIKAACGG